MKPRFNWRQAYDTERDTKEGDLAATINEEPSLTHQSFTTDCDINVIAQRFGLDKVSDLPPVTDPNYYADLTDVPDLRTLLDIQRDAINKFMDLPPKLRAKFDNDMTKLWDFIQDPDNSQEAIRLGLLVKPEEPPTAPPEPPKTDTLQKGVT